MIIKLSQRDIVALVRLHRRARDLIGCAKARCPFPAGETVKRDRVRKLVS